ncbi:MAG: hypothetical protein GXP24_12660 [Planctomycetes bacterium]|nr:hypothetical protein [Planctomycetota bacterium]
MRSFCLFSLSLVALLVSCCLSATTVAQGDSGFKYIEVQVVGPDGKPLADVAVDVKIDEMEFPMPTDEEGKISLNAPSGAKSRLQLSVKHADFAAVSASWQGGESFPKEFSISLEKGEPIGGVVLDEQGEPIEGVKIEMRESGKAETNGELQPLLRGHLATTDVNGQWQVMTKAKNELQLLLKPSHEEYINNASFGSPANWEQLKNLEHKLVLKKGIAAQGRVTDPEGEAIAGALVFLGQHRWGKNKKETITDEEGNFRLNNVSPSNGLLTVAAEGWSPQFRTIQIQREMPSIDFQLQPGKSIRILVTDPDGEPLGGAGVAVENWRGKQTLPQELYRGETDADGIWQSESMPADEVVFSVFVRGHMSSRNNKLVASNQPHTIVLPWPLIVSGKVVEAESGLPLEKFDVVQGIDWGNRNQQIHWERYNTKPGANGKYRMEFTEPRAGHYVRIEAEGYRPEVSRVIRDDEGEVTVNFKLEEGSGPSGIIRTPDGQLAEGVELLVATPEEQVAVYNGHAQQHEGRPTTKTDEQGRYQLPFFETNNIKVVCRHETGYAQLSGKQLEATPNITLHAWAAVEGTVQVGDQPLANESVQLYFNQRYEQGAPQVHWSYTAKTDSEGKFKFERVQGREAIVGRNVRFGDMGQGGFMSSHSHTVPVPLIPGQVAKVQIGGTGWSIKGQILIPKNYGANVSWNMGSVQIYEQNVSVNTGGFFQALGRAIAGGGRPNTSQKPTFRRSYASAIDAEGGFAITDVLPGQYQMTIQLHAAPVSGRPNWQPIGRLHQQITVPEAKDDEKDQNPHDLGEFTLKMTKPTPPN